MVNGTVCLDSSSHNRAQLSSTSRMRGIVTWYVWGNPYQSVIDPIALEGLVLLKAALK